MAKHGRTRLFLMLTVALASACGGSSTSNDGDGVSGSGGQGASGGAGGQGASGGAGSGCQPGTFCASEGATCSDGGCCPCEYVCRDHQWTMSACAGCAGPSCPDAAPTNGAPCYVCSDAPVCDYQECTGAGSVHATCDGSTWTIETTPCEEPPPCGDEANAAPCPEGQLCVAAEVVVGPMSTITYSCENNPCPPAPTTCDCAVALCQATAAPLCDAASDVLVQCTNGAQ
jgi:hypothetical protein